MKEDKTVTKKSAVVSCLQLYIAWALRRTYMCAQGGAANHPQHYLNKSSQSLNVESQWIYISGSIYLQLTTRLRGLLAVNQACYGYSSTRLYLLILCLLVLRIILNHLGPPPNTTVAVGLSEEYS